MLDVVVGKSRRTASAQGEIRCEPGKNGIGIGRIEISRFAGILRRVTGQRLADGCLFPPEGLRPGESYDLPTLQKANEAVLPQGIINRALSSDFLPRSLT